MDINKKECKEDKIPLSKCFDVRIPNVDEVETSSARNKKEINSNFNYNLSHIKLFFPTIPNEKVVGNLNHRKANKFRQISEINQEIIYKLAIIVVIFVVGVALTIFLLNSSRIPRHVRIHHLKKMQNNEPIYLSKLSYPSVSFTTNNLNEKYKSSHKHQKEDVYPKGMTENMKNILKDKRKTDVIVNFFTTLEKTPPQPRRYIPDKETILFDHIYWGPQIENALPQGFGHQSTEIWERYVNQSEIVKMEIGCGRMQNRLVTFRDGMQACVRYRQNTDQIQGEIFSFYLGKILNLTNLAPSVVKVVDLKDKLWSGVAADISASQWNTNRAVVLTQYIPSLESASIPDIFKPSGRHLNKFDVLRLLLRENSTISKSDVTLDVLQADEKDPTMANARLQYFSHVDMKVSNKTVDELLELAQWADLIIFDYLTANLDRIVNNLFNYQWNANIMDGPAHNLAKQVNSGLLVFLDNESGLLHGYRLLKKYNVYHSVMLDNLCMFRKSTIDAVKALYELETLGAKLDDMYHSKNDAVTRDVLPPLPDKNKKILYERLGKILNQVKNCQQEFSKR